MRRSVALFVALAACSRSAEQQPAWHAARTSAPIALFSNGGFESGNLSNWTVTTNINPGITYPPASVTDLNLQAGGTARTYARNGATPQVPFGLSAAATLRYPRYGSWSAVINEGGTTRNVNLLTQSMSTTAADVDSADGQIHVRFVVAPVLQNPAHTNTQQPYYYVLVTNVTQNITLFSRFNYANDASAPWQSDPGTGSGAVTYTNWQVVDVPGTAGSIAIGDTVQAQVIGAGCSLGGHWGEAYVDAFGAFLPGLSVVAHAPQQANAGSNLTTRYAVNNSGATAAANVIVDAPTPPQTTFVSLTAPAGAVCTTPAVGAAGTVTCNFGSMNPLSALNFTLVTAIAAGATGTISNNNYTVRSDSDAALLGPLAATAVTSAVSYADLSVTMTDGTAGVAWSQALTYTIVVSNAGPVTATNATVVDTLPAQLTSATWTCSAAGGGSCGAASGSGNINTTVTLPSGASATYLLNASVVSGSGTSRVTNVVNVANGSGTTDPDTTNDRAAVTNDIGTVVAVTVQKDSTGGGLGTVVSSPAAINCGSACTSASANFVTGNLLSLTATAVPGDSFSSWSGGCTGTTNPCNISPASNTTVTARFIPQSFTITASAPAGNGNISCTSPVLHNQSSACTISPAAGYKLSQLTDNGSDVTGLVVSNSYTISAVAANHTVVAAFLKDYGTACGAGSECAAANCVDGVCCNSACGGQCQACDVAGSVGTCTNATGAPHGSRTACTTDGSACGGSCDGTMANACAYPAGSTVCRAGTCSAGTATSAASCNGTGTCPSSVVTACTPYVCGPTACKTSCAVDTDCISGDYCSAGACVAKKANGATCSANNQCTNANCVDGICCNSACGSQCQACDVAGSVGTCTAVSGAPHGARAACATDGSSCGGSCNGVITAACAYPTSSCRSASCSSGTATAAASCNGAGACPAPSTTACPPYICGATACKTSCAVDTDCISGDYCSAGACVTKKANGATCSASNQCTNANCVDGVCCSSACGGQCQACDVAGSVGTCTAVSGSPHGARAACATDGSACGGSCDGTTTATCAYPTSSCRSASCSSGTATAAASCDGAGACPAPSTIACTPYICGATSCATSCSVDADCISGDYCNAGVCAAKQANGATCSANNQCTNSNCVDGVCCSSACGSQCQACDVAGSVGTCTAVSGAPHGTRVACATDGSSCGGACDGTNSAACAYPTSSCRSASCSAGLATLAASCDGAGNCPALQTQACTPYACGPTACLGNCAADSDCAAGDFCSAGVCVAKFGDGVACAGANQCANGSCADGVCCDQACGGQCQACNVSGNAGHCIAVTGAPQGARPACTSDGTLCGGACDGSHGLACTYPDSTSGCRSPSCSSGTAILAAGCDSAGHCPAQQTQTCNPYLCGATACRGNCSVDTDCAAGNFCSAGVCTSLLAAGASCAGSNQCASAHCTDGVCCDQACGGQCQACDVPGSVGTCASVAGAPHGARPLCTTDGSACGGACDGTNGSACAYPISQCRAPSCSSGVATLASACDGAGRCPGAQTQGCSPYVCGASACLGGCASNSDCASGDWCSAGVCVPLVANGGSCGAAGQCASGNCVDGLCCNSACAGQCEACNVAGSAGTCTAVAGDPRGGRPACGSDGTNCAGACDGSRRDACAYPGVSTECRTAACTAGISTAQALCDGTGRCPARQQSSCNAYVCGANACLSSCTRDSDCANGGICISGACKSQSDPGVWVVAGAGCSSTGASGWPLLLLLAAFALRRRRKAAMAALLLCASAARAQDSATIAVDRFQPGAGAFDVLGVWSADTAQDREWHASIYGSYARDPLRLVQVDHATQIPVLQDQSLLHLGASIGLGDRFEVGAVLPLAVQSSSGTPLTQGPLAAPAPSAGIGDLRILPKARLLSIGGLVLGAAAPFSLPTGRQEAYLGAGSLTFTPTALAELQDLLPVRLLANAGMAVRGSRSLGNLHVGTAITYGLAAEMPLREKLALLASVAGEVNLAGGGSVERPMEMLAALRWSASRGIDVTAGGGPGIGNGYGTPKYRMFVAISITPSMLPARRPLPILPLPEPPQLFPALAVAADPPAPIYQEWNTPEPVLAKLEDDKVDLLAPVLFAHNGDVILPQSRAVLDAAIAILKNHTELSRLRIEGHTDDRGKPAYNLDLSKRRAKAVRSYLVKHGIAAARLESQGYGNTRPVDTNASNDGRAHNRRVELMITQRLQTRTAGLSRP